MIQGQVYQKTGPLLPYRSNYERWAQIYVFDSSTQVTKRIQWMNDPERHTQGRMAPNAAVLRTISEVLTKHNPYAAVLSTAGELMGDGGVAEVDIVLEDETSAAVAGADGHRGVYERPTADMVGTILTDEGRLPQAPMGAPMQHALRPNVRVRKRTAEDRTKDKDDHRVRLGTHANYDPVSYDDGCYDALGYPLCCSPMEPGRGTRQCREAAATTTRRGRRRRPTSLGRTSR